MRELQKSLPHLLTSFIVIVALTILAVDHLITGGEAFGGILGAGGFTMGGVVGSSSITTVPAAVVPVSTSAATTPATETTTTTTHTQTTAPSPVTAVIP